MNQTGLKNNYFRCIIEENSSNIPTNNHSFNINNSQSQLNSSRPIIQQQQQSISQQVMSQQQLIQNHLILTTRANIDQQIQKPQDQKYNEEVFDEEVYNNVPKQSTLVQNKSKEIRLNQQSYSNLSTIKTENPMTRRSSVGAFKGDLRASISRNPTLGKKQEIKQNILEKKLREKVIQNAKQRALSKIIICRRFIQVLKQKQNKQTIIIGVMIKVHQFINQLKMKKKNRNYRILKPKHYEMIQDLSFNNLNSIKKQHHNLIQTTKIFRCITDIVEYLCEPINHLPIIDPNSIFKKMWDIAYLIVVLSTIFFFPIEAAMGGQHHFRNQFTTYGWVFYLFSCLIFTGLDIIIAFNTGYYEKGVVVTKRQSIARHYIYNFLIIDAIGIIPIILEIMAVNYFFKFWNWLIFIKINTVYQIFSDFQDIALFKHKSYNQLSLLKLLMIVIFVAHTFGLAFQTLSDIEERLEIRPNWLNDKEYYGLSWWERYIYSIYFSVTTMTSVGYGDISPLNIYETILIVIGMLISSGMFAYTFNLIGVVVEQIQNDKKKIKNEMSKVNRYLHKKHLNDDLIIQVQKYLEYRFHEENEIGVEDQEKFLSKLSLTLKEKVIHDSNQYLISKCQNTFGLFSEQLQQQLLKIMNFKVFQKDEIIFTEQEFSENPCFYIIESGSVQIYAETFKGNIENTILQTLGPYQAFGKKSFYTLLPRETAAKTIEKSVIYWISRQEFKKILKKLQKDYELFREIRDNIVYYDKGQQIKINCEACNKFSHTTNTCNFIHYTPDREFIILKNNFSKPQPQKYLQRYDKIRYNSRLDIHNVQGTLDLFIDDIEENDQYKHLLIDEYIWDDQEQELINFDQPVQVNNKAKPEFQPILEEQIESDKSLSSQSSNTDSSNYSNDSIPQFNLNSDQKIDQKEEIVQRNSSNRNQDKKKTYTSYQRGSMRFQNQTKINSEINISKVNSQEQIISVTKLEDSQKKKQKNSNQNLNIDSDQSLNQKHSKKNSHDQKQKKTALSKYLNNKKNDLKNSTYHINQNQQKDLNFDRKSVSSQIMQILNNIQQNQKSPQNYQQNVPSNIQNQEVSYLFNNYTLPQIQKCIDQNNKINQQGQRSNTQRRMTQRRNVLSGEHNQQILNIQNLAQMFQQQQQFKDQQQNAILGNLNQYQNNNNNYLNQKRGTLLQKSTLLQDQPNIYQENTPQSRKNQRELALNEVEQEKQLQNIYKNIGQNEISKNDNTSVIYYLMMEQPKIYQNYYVQHNLNIHILAQKLKFNFNKETPGFGKYTFFWRKIALVGGYKRKLKNVQYHSQNFQQQTDQNNNNDNQNKNNNENNNKNNNNDNNNTELQENQKKNTEQDNQNSIGSHNSSYQQIKQKEKFINSIGSSINSAQQDQILENNTFRSSSGVRRYVNKENTTINSPSKRLQKINQMHLNKFGVSDNFSNFSKENQNLNNENLK